MSEVRVGDGINDFPEARAFWERMGQAGSQTAFWLHECWREPSAYAERSALWRVAELELLCADATDRRRDNPILPLDLQDARPEVRYELDVAIRAMPRLLPPQVVEGARELPGWRERPADFSGEPPAVTPDIEATWASWVHGRYWPTRPTRDAETDRGQATLLGIAAERIGKYVAELVEF